MNLIKKVWEALRAACRNSSSIWEDQIGKSLGEFEQVNVSKEMEIKRAIDNLNNYPINLTKYSEVTEDNEVVKTYRIAIVALQKKISEKPIVYLAHYTNGESYEDFDEWNGEAAYKTKEGCIKEIEDLGYKWVEEKYPNGCDCSGYRMSCENDESYCGYAKVVELPLIIDWGKE